MADTGRRMLLLLSLLQAGRAWPAADLAARPEVGPRTLGRDVDRLRGLGHPVRTRRTYQLPAGRALPPLVLDADEAVAVAVGLHPAEQAGRVTAGTWPRPGPASVSSRPGTQESP